MEDEVPEQDMMIDERLPAFLFWGLQSSSKVLILLLV